MTNTPNVERFSEANFFLVVDMKYLKAAEHLLMFDAAKSEPTCEYHSGLPFYLANWARQGWCRESFDVHH